MVPVDVEEYRPPRKKSTGRKAKAAGGLIGKVSEIIRARRAELGLRLEDIRERTGGRISTGQMSGYERGVEPGIEKLYWLAVALEYPRTDSFFPDEAKDVLRRRGRTLAEVEQAVEGKP